MMTKNQKRMATEVLDVGNDKVWIDPARREEVEQAITRADIRRLVLRGAIKVKKVNQQSRGRARILMIKKSKGRRSGRGSRKGPHQTGKELWMRTVRALRRKLKTHRDTKDIDTKTYRKLYLMVKGGAFRSKGHMDLYMKEKGLVKEK